jgi:hypothetical protein
MPQLTQDILDLIVDELAASGKTDNGYRYYGAATRLALCNCALSSSVLRHRAQSYLFIVFGVDEKKKAILTVELATEQVDLTQYTKRLWLYPGIPGREDWMYEPSDYDLSKVLPFFPNIESVTLSNISLDDFGASGLPIEDAFASLGSANVQRLLGITWDRSSDADFVRLLRVIHRTLDSLELRHCEWKADPVNFPRDMQPFCSLKQLHITAFYGTSSISYSWFTCLRLDNLRVLHFSLQLSDDVQPWQEVLESAPLIQSLAISQIPIVPHLHHIDLASLHHLEVLKVSSAQNLGSYDMNSNTDPIVPPLEVIHTTQSTKLTEVTAQFEHDLPRLYQKVDWNNAKGCREYIRSISKGAIFRFVLRGAIYEEGGGKEILDAVAEMRSAAEGAGLSPDEIDSQLDKHFRPPSD